MKHLAGPQFFRIFRAVAVFRKNGDQTEDSRFRWQGVFPFHPVDPKSQRRSHAVFVYLPLTPQCICLEVAFFMKGKFSWSIQGQLNCSFENLWIRCGPVT